MLKNISNLGTTLNKTEQQSINGGAPFCDPCNSFIPCHLICPKDDETN